MGVHPHKIMKEITQYLVIKEQEELKRAKKLKEKFLRLNRGANSENRKKLSGSKLFKGRKIQFQEAPQNLDDP
mgnify:CR=1 FL=1